MHSAHRAAAEVEDGGGVVSDVFQLAREMRVAIDRELSPHGVTTQQAALVLITHLREGCGVSHLADALGADVAGITRLIDRLEAKGMVARGHSPLDRRAVVVKVTPSGDQLTPELRAAFQRAHERLLDGVSAAEIRQFRSVVARLRRNVAALEGQGAGA